MEKNKVKTNKKIVITIPAYNEETTIERVVKNVIQELSKFTDNFYILLVNDGSWDKTAQVIEELRKKYKNRVQVIHHKKNKGFSGAMKTCYEHAKGDLIFLGPADGQFNYSQVKLFVNELEKNKRDIVTAYRVINEEKITRKISSFAFHLIAKMLFGIRLKEFSSCILYTRKLRDSISIQAHPVSCMFLPELIYKSMKKKYTFGEVPIRFEKRKGGQANGANYRMIIKTLNEMFRFWWDIRIGKVK